MNKDKGGGYRSVISGRYVTAKHGRASPGTTVKEAPGAKGSSGPHHRSANTGRYVTTAHGRLSPKTSERSS